MDGFALQGRTEPIPNTQATQFSAFACGYTGTDGARPRVEV